MLQKNIIGYEKEYDIKNHPSIKGLQIIEGKNNLSLGENSHAEGSGSISCYKKETR